ncbi:MAG: AAA family ATPase [Halanaerobiales bacterium]|nr:AAA family ATPase [Halanaerobiales bacterium]
MKSGKKIPYGISDFKDLILQDYIYVDKTKYIELLESYGEKYIFFLRPRRFGKSLFLSMLARYYDINTRDDFNKLFAGLYIGQHSTPLANSFYILNFNFSGINTSSQERLLNDYSLVVQEELNNFLKRYDLDFKYETTGLPSSVMRSFLSRVQFEINGKIYVFIDEYDHFANELLSFQTEVFEETISKTGFVRKWYEVLKIGTQNGLIDRMFVTGVSPITLDSLTSGFNIASNLTRDKNLNEMMGFTEEEVVDLLKIILKETDSIEMLLPTLRKYYNGYLFSQNAIKRVYNSDMVLYYLNSFKKSNTPPEDLIDTNIASDYAKLQKLFTLKNRERNYQILEKILMGQSQTTTITREYSLAKDFTEADFLSLLFYLGFLTIEEKVLKRVRLKVPNYAIKELYFDFFFKILQERFELNLDISEIQDSIETLALTGDIDKFLKVVEKTLKQLSFRDFIEFDEKYIKIIMYTYLVMSKAYYIKSEYETKEGYVDIGFFQHPDSEESLYEGLIELKYIKKSAYKKEGWAIIDKKLAEGREQLLSYQDDDELKHRHKLLKWVLVFVGDECLEKLKIDQG